MSTQTEGLVLRHTPDNIGYRLIELSAELQALLESSDAPTLTIESSDKTVSAILKTPQKSYALRQKNTSNALILLAPHDSPASGEPGVGAISTIHETVELEEYRESDTKEPPKSKLSGKWHEKFGRAR
ncbi:hypothetical protein B0I35DRAFT_430009 [Stachybotrys elegans]|uniref:Uncharacterized protein n=1 Tax=Stachybotrys elegans TaxID=80388 RepID=A0A8K0SQB4_9HYPO|nr:hypothetical protein B0I35DRAFT_430009 [Stachybotrys elegans]